MIKKIFHIILWLLLLAWFPVIMGFVNRANDDLLCNEIAIQISDSSSVRFVTQVSIREDLAASEMKLQGYPMEEIETRKLEKILEKDPYIANAEVFITIDGKLSIDIEQRRPVIRIMPGGETGFYLDAEGKVLPVSDDFSPRILLLTGYKGLERFAAAGEEENRSPEEMQLLSFATFINENEFWKNQIVQLYAHGKDDYELIPRVGAHQVLFGSLDGYEYKLKKLKLLYDEGFKQYGWNTYNKINLKYSNQIICTKR